MILLAVPAAIILLWALLRGRVPHPLGLVGVLLSLGAYGFGALLVVEDSKHVTFLPKVRLECAVEDDRLEPAIEAATSAARTGRIGDGKIFVEEVR